MFGQLVSVKVVLEILGPEFAPVDHKGSLPSPTGATEAVRRIVPRRHGDSW